MIIFEFKVKAKEAQYRAIDEAIRTSQFIQNKCLRYWTDNEKIGKYDLNKYCAVLAAEFPFASELNSMARQAAAERAWAAIARFYDNCKRKVKGKKGYPKFKKHARSVEYKTSGWKLSPNRKAVTFRDGKNNRRLAKSISDAGWSTFRQWLEYFGFKYGKVTVAVPPYNTSQNCSNCGAAVKKSLSTRTHVCPHCGFIADRDINAAINILKLALSTVGHTGTYAWGDLPSWAVGAILLSNGELMNQESPRL
jgi:transposase